ncbi:MAG TPA: class I SAM-dependent methyltransferase [Terriglobia bacterium]|nr:class I SAM-dependent methyltransferase [Terriglobia bacterium]
MGVASHLGIRLEEYDARIRGFIPDYEEMLDVVARAIPAGAKTLVDLGIGTGALAWRCAQVARRARIVGIDADADILKMARQRVGSRAHLICGSFLRSPLPRCNAVVASLALHHIRSRRAKNQLYRRIQAALRPRGLFITLDYHPAGDARLARQQRHAWIAHLLESYSTSEAAKLLASWAREDFYTPLEIEIESFQQSGFKAHLLWRRGGFAVVMGRR